MFGHTTPNARTITLYPDAFSSRQELIRTLGHERVYVYQTRTFGPAPGHPGNRAYEAGAIASEDSWWTYAQSVGAG